MRIIRFRSLMTLSVICLTIQNQMIKSWCVLFLVLLVVTYALSGKLVSVSTKNVIVILKRMRHLYSRNISVQNSVRMVKLWWRRKTNVRRLDLRLKFKIWFNKMHACALRGNFFSCYYQKIRKGKFFELIRVIFEKQVFEVGKK